MKLEAGDAGERVYFSFVGPIVHLHVVNFSRKKPYERMMVRNYEGRTSAYFGVNRSN